MAKCVMKRYRWLILPALCLLLFFSLPFMEWHPFHQLSSIEGCEIEILQYATQERILLTKTEQIDILMETLQNQLTADGLRFDSYPISPENDAYRIDIYSPEYYYNFILCSNEDRLNYMIGPHFSINLKGSDSLYQQLQAYFLP